MLFFPFNIKVFFAFFMRKCVKINDINIQNDTFPLFYNSFSLPKGSEFPSVSIKWFKPKPSKSLVLRCSK